MIQGTNSCKIWTFFLYIEALSFFDTQIKNMVSLLLCPFLIASSCWFQAFEDVNLYKNQTMIDVLYYLNLLFAAIFTIEMLMKWCAFGFRKYFTNFWCLLDFAIVVVSSFVHKLKWYQVECTGWSNTAWLFNVLVVVRSLSAVLP